MTDNQHDPDGSFRTMIKNFTHEMITVHGLTVAEVRALVNGELLREYKRRSADRVVADG